MAAALRFPALSPGVLLAPFGGGGVAYDLATERLHVLSAAGFAVASAGRGSVTRVEAVAEWAESTGVSVGLVDRGVDAALVAFEDLGLVGGPEVPPRAPVAVAPVSPLRGDDRWFTVVAGAHRIRFRGRDAALIDRLGDLLGVAGSTVAVAGWEPGEPTADFVVMCREDSSRSPASGGVASVEVQTDSLWVFADEDALVAQVVGMVNDFVVRSREVVVLHAALVVDPSGRVVVLPAPPGAGKSTLTAGLVQRGWVYGGDESVSIRPGDGRLLPYPKPLTLGVESRRVLGLDVSIGDEVPVGALSEMPGVLVEPVGSPDVVVCPCFDAGASEPTMERLEGVEALVALVEGAINLRYVGERGFETLVGLAEAVPVFRCRYGSSADGFSLLEGLSL